eukprot:2907332-Prymnesium_polylepis.1
MWEHPKHGSQLEDTWAILRVVVSVIASVHELGGNSWIENPPNWGWFRADAASHSSIFDTTLVRDLAALIGALFFTHDQCGWGALAAKRTTFMVDPRWSF